MIPESLQKKFGKFPAGEQEEIYRLLAELRPNTNKWNELLEWVWAISRRDGGSPLELIQNIIAQVPHPDTPQQLEFVRIELQKIRYPRYMKKKEEFEKIIKSLKLGNKIQVTPSPFFEEDHLELKFRISSEDEKKEIIKLLEGEGWKDLFRFLK